MEKNQSKKNFKCAVELPKQRKKLSLKQGQKMLHKFVRNNRKKGNDAIMELEVNGKVIC